MCRYALSVLIPLADGQWPWATFLANVVGCLLIGLLSSWLMQTQRSPELYALLATGFCGGFTTFSTFSKEVWHLYQHQQATLALVYAVGSLLIGMLALVAGIYIFRFFS